MNKYVPYAKKSKKAQKEDNNKKRKTWNGLNPVTRAVPDKRNAYNRQKFKRGDYL